MVKFHITCQKCGKVFNFEVSDEQYRRYDRGLEFVQDIFPDMSADLREILVSGVCGDCFDKLFPADEAIPIGWNAV